ncbi:MAG TPA: S8 family serine peptidase, partial [Roseiflexaceae bacterium]|nr:S8 family serine peptidase [Roseiflexaceae bacterium]
VRRDAAPAALAARLAAAPGVVYAEPVATRRSARVPQDEMAGEQWALAAVAAFDAWETTTGGGVTIALLDTGVSPTHPDLRDNLLPGFDFFNLDEDPRDDDGHGTYTAGVAAARGDNRVGVAGICWDCTILPVKVLDRRGHGDDATIAAGIRFAVDRGARVISMSLGGPEDTRVMREAIAYARERGVLVVAAAGNGQAEGNLPSYPAAYPSVLAVSATGRDDTVAAFATTGDFVDIAAPGAGVWSTLWSRAEGDTYGAANGTSAACPHVAGAAALLLSVRPDLTPEQVAELLQLGADDRGPPGRDAAYGAGRLNIARALQILGEEGVLSRSRIQGTVAGVDPALVTVSLGDGRQVRPDTSGFYSFDGLPAGAYTVSVSGVPGAPAPRQVWLSGTALSVATLDFAVGGEAARHFAPVPPPPGGATYFPQTQHTLRGVFRAYWRAHGGLPIFGYPISEEFVERGDDGREYLVQYFERHRLELHPERPPPYHVQLARIGDAVLRQAGRDWFSLPRGEPHPGCLFFPETGHSLCEPFLSAWRASGLELDGRRGKSIAESLALFGMPLSEPQIETLADGSLAVVQWFERARFEDHGPDGVLLGLLGSELARARGWGGAQGPGPSERA